MRKWLRRVGRALDLLWDLCTALGLALVLAGALCGLVLALMIMTGDMALVPAG